MPYMAAALEPYMPPNFSVVNHETDADIFSAVKLHPW